MRARTRTPSRCIVPECINPMIEGTGRCVDHPVKTLSLEEKIAAGPKFESKNCAGKCICDPDKIVFLDAATKLCVFCWRIWCFTQTVSPARIPIPPPAGSA